MIRLMREHAYWARMDADAEKEIKNCNGCQELCPGEAHTPISSTARPRAPWDLIAIDFYSIPEVKLKVLTCVDYFSKVLMAEVVTHETTEEVKRCLKNFFKFAGIPKAIKHDNGPSFRADFKEFLDELGIISTPAVPLWPQSNGLIERQHQGLKKAIMADRAMGQLDARKSVDEYVFAYNTRHQYSTDRVPLESLQKRPIRTELPERLDHENYFDSDEETNYREMAAKERMKLRADQRRKAKRSDLTAGNYVRVSEASKSKHGTRFSKDIYLIESISSTRATLKRIRDSKIFHRAIAHLKRVEAPVASEEAFEEVEEDSEDEGRLIINEGETASDASEREEEPDALKVIETNSKSARPRRSSRNQRPKY